MVNEQFLGKRNEVSGLYRQTLLREKHLPARRTHLAARPKNAPGRKAAPGKWGNCYTFVLELE